MFAHVYSQLPQFTQLPGLPQFTQLLNRLFSAQTSRAQPDDDWVILPSTQLNQAVRKPQYQVPQNASIRAKILDSMKSMDLEAKILDFMKSMDLEAKFNTAMSIFHEECENMSVSLTDEHCIVYALSICANVNSFVMCVREEKEREVCRSTVTNLLLGHSVEKMTKLKIAYLTVVNL
jgi:hypothetical protein